MRALSWIGRVLGKLVSGLQTLAGRAAAGIAVFGALVWFLWPSSSWQVEPEPLLALIVSAAGWLGSLGPTRQAESEKPLPPTTHDVKLLARFRETLTEPAKRFLRDQDLLSTFNWKTIDCLLEISHSWRGAEFAFDDEELEALFVPLIDSIRGFTNELALRSYMVRGSDERASVLTDHDREYEVSDRTRQTARELNDQATQLAESIDEFIRFSRPRLERG